MDATIIDLCLSVFPLAHFRRTKGGIDLYTLLGLKENIPSFIAITQARVHEVNILDELIPEAGAIYIMDHGYLDFELHSVLLLQSLFHFLLLIARIIVSILPCSLAHSSSYLLMPSTMLT